MRRQPILDTLRQFPVVLAAAFLVVVPTSAQTPEPASSGVETIRTSREYKQLRRHAQTAEDYIALSNWCKSREAQLERDKSEFRFELSKFYANPTGFPKYPTRDQTLKTLISNAERSEAKWRELDQTYSAAARDLIAAARPPE